MSQVAAAGRPVSRGSTTLSFRGHSARKMAVRQALCLVLNNSTGKKSLPKMTEETQDGGVLTPHPHLDVEN